VVAAAVVRAVASDRTPAVRAGPAAHSSVETASRVRMQARTPVPGAAVVVVVRMAQRQSEGSAETAAPDGSAYPGDASQHPPHRRAVTLDRVLLLLLLVGGALTLLCARRD
jgi:hypothetical protein